MQLLLSAAPGALVAAPTVGLPTTADSVRLRAPPPVAGCGAEAGATSAATVERHIESLGSAVIARCPPMPSAAHRTRSSTRC